MKHYEIRNRCILRFVKLVYCPIAIKFNKHPSCWGARPIQRRYDKNIWFKHPTSRGFEIWRYLAIKPFISYIAENNPIVWQNSSVLFFSADNNIFSASFVSLPDFGDQINIPTIGVQNTVTSGVGFTNVSNCQSVAQGNPSDAFVMSNVIPDLNGNNGFLQQVCLEK